MSRLRSQLELIVGPMFSGKSSELIRRIRRYRHANKSCILVKPALDNRYTTDKVTTHDKVGEQCLVVSRLKELVCNQSITADIHPGIDVVGIDEAQFFPDLQSQVLHWLDVQPQLLVIVAGLSGTFERKAFGQIWDLAPRAGNVTFQTGVCCICFTDSAAYSLRVTASKEVIEVGSDSYRCVCESCYRQHT